MITRVWSEDAPKARDHPGGLAGEPALNNDSGRDSNRGNRNKVGNGRGNRHDLGCWVNLLVLRPVVPQVAVLPRNAAVVLQVLRHLQPHLPPRVLPPPTA